MADQSRMTRLLVSRLWRRGLLLACLLLAAPAWSASILLTAAEDGAGVRAFTQALAQQRPNDQVSFTPSTSCRRPGTCPPAPV